MGDPTNDEVLADEAVVGFRFTALSTSLDGVMQSLRGPSRAHVGGVFGGWEDAVGTQVAAHVRPIKLDRGTLVVEVDDPAWATQVKFLQQMIIEQLATKTGAAITRIDVRVDQRNARGAKY